MPLLYLAGLFSYQLKSDIHNNSIIPRRLLSIIFRKFGKPQRTCILLRNHFRKPC